MVDRVFGCVMDIQQRLNLKFKGDAWSRIIRILGIFLLSLSFIGQKDEGLSVRVKDNYDPERNDQKVENGFTDLIKDDHISGWEVYKKDAKDPQKIEADLPELEILAKSAIAVSESGKILFAKEKDQKLLPASTVKITTALVVLEEFSLGDSVRVPENCVKLPGNSVGLLAGDYLKVEDLLYGVLVFSGSDATCSLYQHAGNTIDSFTKKMNQKAVDIGLNNTLFSNPIGFDGAGNGNHTTAVDLAKLTNVAMGDGVFRKIVGTREVSLRSTKLGRFYSIRNTNDLLHLLPGIVGVKTGFTENAGGNLVSAYQNQGHEIIVVVMGSQDRFGDTRKVIDWVFSNYNF